MIDTCRPQIKAARQGLIEFHALTSGNYPGERIPKGTLPGLSSIGWWNAKGAPGWGLEAHRNEGLEIVFLETGSMPFIANGKRFRIQSGDITITRPWDEHRLGNPNIGPGILHWVIIDVGVRTAQQAWHWPEWVILEKSDLKRLTNVINTKKAVITGASRRIKEIFRSLSDAVASRGHRRMSTIAVNINRLLLDILKELAGEKPEKRPSVEVSREAILQFLTRLEGDMNLCAMPWTLSKMAEQCRVGATFFVEKCREIVNESPMHFLNNCRLDHARRLLESGQAGSITSAAMSAGFSSSQYFATCFRKRFGHSPSDLNRRS